MTFNIDWTTTNIDGSNTINDGGDSVGVSISTPQNSDHDQWTVQDGMLFSTDVCRDELATLEFDQDVTNISFTLLDVDRLDEVTILAYDAAGNLVPVTFEVTGVHTVSGNTVVGDTTNAPGPGDSNPDQDINVTIAGPIAKLVIIHDDGPASGDSGAIAVSDISFDLAGPALDGIVEGTAGDDLIDVAYTGDPEGDMIDNNDAILPGEVGDDDIVHAGAGNDTVYAGAGNDFVLGEDGNDTLYGEDGNDVLCGNDGDDTIYGGEGADVLEGMNDNDTLFGGAGADRIYGDAGSDELHGGDGNDQMFGGTGDDLLDGGDGNDVMRGGDDQDTFIGRGNDTIFGGEGGVDNDTLDLRGAGQVNIIYDATDSERGTVQFLDAGGTVTGVLDFHEIENILTDPQGDGYVDGTAGDDLIDTAYTGDPDGDMIDNNDALLPGEVGDDDIVRAGDGNDTVLAGAGDDEVYGDAGDDTLSGGDGTNVLYGGTGDDTFVGGDGADSFAGGAGQDNLDYSGSGAAVNVNLATGALSGGDADNDTIIQGIDGVIGSDFDDTLIGFDHEGTTPADTFTNELFGGGGDDYIEGRAGDDLLDGGDGADTIIGGDGSDTVDGGAGNDVIDTSGSDPQPDVAYPGQYPADTDPSDDIDTVFGGAGNDTISTGDDADIIDGGTGNDTIDGGIDNDTIDGGDGNDTIIGGEGSDIIDGGTGDDLIYGGLDPSFPDALNIPDDGSGPFGPDLVPTNGMDVIHGGDGNDTIFGADDDDTLFGDAGNDTIDGGIDDDTIDGGSGDDTLIGGQGDDTMIGGTGNDSFDGGIGTDTMSGGDDRDTFSNITAGDVVDGNEGGDDYDTLDLTGSRPVDGTLRVIYDAGNPENGHVDFRDSDGNVIGTMDFTNIEHVIPCFTPGSLIATPKGERLVEELRMGDKIITRDNGIQEIRWVGEKKLDWKELAANPHLKPILIRKGSLGNDLPERDMMVSPNHRMLVANDKTMLYFEEREVLAAAKHLVNNNGVHAVETMGTSYLHFMFDNHEVVLSDGAWTESFQPGDYTLEGIGNAQRAEILELFPELATAQGIKDYQSARKTLKAHEARLLAK